MNPAAPLVFHSKSDNFVQFFNMLEGQGSVHAAHGMMLQDIVREQCGEAQLVLPSNQESKLLKMLNNSLTVHHYQKKSRLTYCLRSYLWW